MSNLSSPSAPETPSTPVMESGLTSIREDEDLEHDDVFDTDIQPFNTNRVTTFIRCNVPNVELKDETNRELEYVLPFSSSRSVEFAHLFDQLDKYMERLHISSYGISDTSLEQVFMNVMRSEKDKLGKYLIFSF